jgi:hypothetical protein
VNDKQTDNFYDSLTQYYQKSFKIKTGKDIVKKGVFCLCRRRDFSFEMVCMKKYINSDSINKENEQEKYFTISLPMPFTFDHEENSILLDYRVIPNFKNRGAEIANILNTLLTTHKKPHRFMDKIVEIVFLDEKENS